MNSKIQRIIIKHLAEITGYDEIEITLTSSLNEITAAIAIFM